MKFQNGAIQILLFVVIQSSVTVVSHKSDFKFPKYGNALTDGVLEIISRFYVEKTKTINILHASETNDTINDDYINEVLYHIPKKVSIRCENYLHYNKINRIRINNIFFVDTYNSFKNILKLMDTTHFDYQGHYLIVMTTYSYDQYDIMSKIFTDLWSNLIVNSAIFWHLPLNDNEAILYTYYPYSKFYCGVTFPIEQNHFRLGKWVHNTSDFFPNKVKNLHGCPLKVSLIPTAPFIMVTKLDDGSSYIEGIDGILLQMLSVMMNFTVKADTFESQGVINFEDGTATGAIWNWNNNYVVDVDIWNNFQEHFRQ